MIGGMNVQMLARSQLGWDLTGSSLAVTIVGVGFAPPMLLFSLFGGVVSDRFDNKNIIQIRWCSTGLFRTHGYSN